MYGKFDTAIVGFIEDQVAKLIKKKSKDLNTIASAFQSLEQTDADISISSTQAKLEVFKTKSDAQIQRVNTEANLTLAQKDAYTTQINANQELAKLFMDKYEKKILNSCNDSLYTQLKPTNYTGKFIISDKLINISDDIDDIFYVNKDGEIKDEADCTDKKPECKDFIEINCSDLASFTTSKRSKVTLPTEGGILPVGIYEIDMSAGGGGRGGSYNWFNQGRNGKNGGKGELRKLLLTVFEPTKYNISIGSKGGDGAKSKGMTHCGNAGSNGGNSTITLDGTMIIAKGGAGSGACCSKAGGGCDEPTYSGNGSEINGWVNIIKIK